MEDEFDRSHTVAQIKRFSSLYNIHGGTMDEIDELARPLALHHHMLPVGAVTSSTASHAVDPGSASAPWCC